MDLGLAGRQAIVLAASRGLGRAAADALAAEGASIALCGRDGSAARDAAREISDRFGVPAHGFRCDVSDGEELRGFLRDAEAALGGADVLVNNCGGPPAGRSDAFGDADWSAATESVLMSVIRSCRHVVPGMVSRGFGRVINITSVSVRQPLEDMTISNTLRAAVAAFSKSLALEVAGTGVLVHCVMPGSFLTDRNRSLGTSIAERRGISFEELVAEWQAGVPLRRMGDPAEFGAMIAFLASERCSFTTGSCIAVEGGQIRSTF